MSFFARSIMLKEFYVRSVQCGLLVFAIQSSVSTANTERILPLQQALADLFSKQPSMASDIEEHALRRKRSPRMRPQYLGHCTDFTHNQPSLSDGSSFVMPPSRLYPRRLRWASFSSRLKPMRSFLVIIPTTLFARSVTRRWRKPNVRKTM